MGINRTVLLLASMATAVLLASGVALALPSESPDPTPMLNGPVRAIEQVGNNVWVGGNFTQVKKRDGTVVADVANVAVFNSTTGELVRDVKGEPIAPKLGAGSTATNVRDIDVYGDNVVIAGDFPGPTSTQRNLVALDGATGGLVRWFGGSPQKMQSVLAAPDLGRVYGGSKSLEAFDFSTGKRQWSRATAAVDQSIHSHNPPAGYKDLERDGSTIWAACVCDDLGVSPSKALALIKLSTEGARDASWVAEVGSTDLMGISVAEAGDGVYLGAGGSDWVARFSKSDGSLKWKKDTSGSAQVVEVMEGRLVVGGHFVEVADQAGDRCGARTSNPGTLDPWGECQRRDGLAVYSFDGVLDPNWDPALTGKYNLAWALHPEPVTGRLHVGGEFTHVDGIRQEYYARFSPPPPPCTINGTSSGETLTGTTGEDIICADGGDDIIRGLGGNDTLRGEAGNDRLFGGVGNDALDGGLGADTASYSASLTAVVASLATNAATGEGSDTFAGVENLLGSPQADTLTGSAANDTLRGGAGNDRLFGGVGNDALDGGLDADTAFGDGGADSLKGQGASDRLFGGTGDDALEGGTGTDTAYFTDSPAAVTASLATNTATGEGKDGLVGVENLTGSAGNDRLTGSDGANTLVGRNGGDSIVGRAGADRLLGDTGNDTLNSRDAVAGNDTLNGGDNTDTCLRNATEASILGCERK